MTITRRAASALALALLSSIALSASFGPAAATEPVAYTDQAFAAAEKAGGPILIDTFATWCDICKRQKPIIDKLLQDPRYKDVTTFRVNFDTQKDIMRKFKAQLQSTLIVYRGEKEVGRSVGETQEEWIDDLLSKSTASAKS